MRSRRTRLKNYVIGSRWISEAEPELGLGLIVEAQNKSVAVFFPGSGVDRRYGMQTAPLKRIQFAIGDEIKSNDGETLVVEELKEENGLISYFGQGKCIAELKLSDRLSFSKPEERLFAGSIDSNKLFEMRYDVLLQQRKYFQMESRGFLGPRLNLISHQFYVAQTISERQKPRVMLADEVGLGKTIEAGLIIHQLIQTGRAERVLILVPDSLVYQWFVEMLKKFQLSFTTVNNDSDLDKKENPFDSGQFFIVSMKYLMQDAQLLDDVLSVKFDIVVVDEAHQLKWTPENSSAEYDLVQTLTKNIPGVLLLSGTPEILGLAGHFSRLHLLDPERFHNFEHFLEETMKYQELSKIVKELQKEKNITSSQTEKLQKLGIQVSKTDSVEVINELIDIHGTGRIYFRNTRKSMSSYSEFFPKRVLHKYPLKLGKGKKAEAKLFQDKIEWLAGFLEKTKDSKTLLLCHERDMVLSIEAKLKTMTNAKIAVFHSGMSLIARDRQAAYFLDPEGAQILLSTEIGSEGRNFEFAKHLILLDLPKLPDLLEQRIGRLDRIGQKNEINIHLPYVLESSEEVLYRWYHEGLNAFEDSPRGATEVYVTVQPTLKALIESANNGDHQADELDKLIIATKSEHKYVAERLEEGQDRLVELNSFNPVAAKNTLSKISEVENDPELRSFLLRLFNQLGVDVEELAGDLLFIKPSDNMYLPHFPGLPNDGMSISFIREVAMRREDVSFMTWDHPLVTGIMEFISSKEVGNITAATWRGKAKENFLIEAYLVFEVLADKKLQAEKYFPPTPLRVLLNQSMQDITQKYSKKIIDEDVMIPDNEKLEKVKSIPKEFVKECIKKAKEYSIPRAKQYKEKFKTEMITKLDGEINRLKTLRSINPTVSAKDIQNLEMTKQKLISAMDNPSLRLDSLRFIL
jgi:ATP-dependent helicase HepA